MKQRLLIASGIAALCGIGTVAYFKTRDLPAEAMLARLPTDNASILSIDFGTLRQGGLFEMLPVVDEEPEYKSFVGKTGFDYKRDLDQALVSFHTSGVYFLVKGRFDWKRLEAYASEQGGGCFNGLCRMPGSTPSRKISFFPVNSHLMAMAVSADDWAASRLNAPARSPRALAAPRQPVWVSFSSAAFKSLENFPEGTRLFAKAMQDAESATLSLAPQGKALEAQLEVVCRDSREASILTEQFQKMTALLVELIRREKQTPSPGDLSGVLTAGVFRQEDTRVLGRWPIERVFLENLAGKAR